VDLFGESYYNCSEDPYEDLSDFELMNKMVMYVAPREAEKLRMSGHYTGQTLVEFERAEHVAKYLKKLRQKGNENTDEAQLLEEAKGGLISELFHLGSNLEKRCQITTLSTILLKMLRRVICHPFLEI
jgi:hypothetical protein